MASQPGHVVRVDTIVDTLWGDDPPPSAVKTVQSHVLRLRRSLRDADGQVIETAPGGYRLAVDRLAVDAGQFEQLVADARQLVREGDLLAAVDRFVEAVALWRGPAYVEFRETDFGTAEGVRLDELCLAAREDLADAQIASGSASAAVVGLESLVHDSSGREGAWLLLMRALYASGRQHDALGAFQRARRGLAEFGLEPGAQLSDMERRILEHDPALAPVSGTAMLAGALRTSGAMFGRDAERRALITAWHAAKSGFGQVRILSGPLESGRTRIAIDLAGRALADGAAVEYARGTDILSVLGWARTAPANPQFGREVDALSERCRSTPLLLIVDDVEWATSEAVDLVRAVAATVDQLALFLLVVIDRSGGGPAVTATDRLDPTGSSTIDVEAMPSEELAAVISAEGVDPNAVAGIIAVSNGLPGVAKRESAAWAERTASERLRIAAASSLGASAVAQRAQASVLDEVVELVAARARRDELWSARWAGRQPYRALATYGPQDAELFVGRERLVAELAAHVLERRLVVVVGSSGSGKSSLVRAGLIPLARSGRLPGTGAWGTHTIVPGSDPLAALEVIEELDEPGSRVLVVDQFEEIFAAPADALDRFCDRLLDLAGDPDLNVHVVLVIRSDQYTRLASIPTLTDAATDNLLMVGPPSDDEMRRIVVEPARRTGIAVEPALVDLVTRDVGGHEAALPLVSAALSEVWERRDGNLLRAERYIEIGGLATAVERLGERAVASAGESHIAGMRRILLMLADATDDGVWTRRRVPVDELPEDPAALAALVDARLVVRHDQTIEITHEVVFRTWPRLVRWLEFARTDLVLERDLRAAARGWDTDGRTDDNLYRGARLHAALEWAERNPEVASPVVDDFLTAGRQHAERHEHEVQEQLQRERRARRRVTWALGAAALLLAIATFAGATALLSRNEAEQERRTATARELAAASTASLIDDPERSILLALAAVDETRSRGDSVLPEAESALHQAVTSSRIVDRFPGVGGTLDWSPDGTMFVTEGQEDTGLIDIRDAETGASIQSFHAHDPDVNDVAFSNDSSMLATTGDDGAVRVWNPRTGAKILDYQGDVGGFGAWGPSFSRDDTMLVVSSHPGIGRVIDLETGREVVEFDDFGIGSSFSPDGRRIAVAGSRPRVVDLETGEQLFALDNGFRERAIWSPDGQSIVTVGNLEPTIWDATTGERRFTVIGHRADVVAADWSPDSNRLATASLDGTARIWEIGPDGGREVLAFSSRDTSNGLAGVAFSPDGTRLMTSDVAIAAVSVWDVSPAGGAEWVNVPDTLATVDGADFTPDSDRVVLNAGAGTMSVTDATTGERVSTIGPPPGGDDNVERFELSPDGQVLASTTSMSPVDLWEASTGDHLLALNSQNDAHVGDLDWSRDGDLLAIAYDVRQPDPGEGRAWLEVVDRTGAEVGRVQPDPGFWFSSVSFSPNLDLVATTHDRLERDDPATADLQLWDWRRGTLVRTVKTSSQKAIFDPTGRRIATARWLEGAIDMWDARTGERVASLTAPAPANDLAFSPDGALLATSHTDGTTRLWDVEAGVQVLALQADDDTTFGAQFSPDGSKLATVSASGIARVWALDLDDLIAIARKGLTRGFTDNECRQYLHLERCPDA